MSMRYVSLKALQRSHSARSETSENDWHAPLLNDDTGLLSGARTIRIDPERLAQIMGATTKTNQYGDYLSVRCWCAQPPRYSPDSRALKLLSPEAPDEIADPDRWLFLDTETTGLAGGSGMYAFLVGVAWWEDGGLEIEQFFLREQSEERALLFALRERIAGRPILVSFNGKSFDWPLLETRYRMSRKISVPTPRAHLDFLHPARNLWRLRLGSVRLSELERHVLGWNRGCDVMSELIPSLYFDFLRGGPPEPLLPIFYHNQMDLRGLAGLSARVLSVLADAENQCTDAFELFGISRICERRGESARARVLFQRSIEGELPVETERAARRSLAIMAKRDGDFARASELWESMLGNSREGLEAYEQLAIYYERHAREPHEAASITKDALAELRRANRTGTVAASLYKRSRARFERRLTRLERKTSGVPLMPIKSESGLLACESN